MASSETGTVVFHSFWRLLRKNWILLSAIALAVGIGVWALYSFVAYTPLYSSSSQFYVSNVSKQTSLYSAGQTAGAESMATYCADYVKGSVVLNAVLKEVGLADQMTSEQLAGTVSVQVSAGSAAFWVTVTGKDPEQIFQISKAIERILPLYVDYFNRQSETPDGVGESAMLKLIHESALDRTPDNRSTLYKYPIYAAFIAFVLAYAILLIRASLSQTVYSRRDFEEKMPNAPIFGVIPHWEAVPAESGRKKGRRYKHRKNKGQHVCMSERVITESDTPFRVAEAFRQLCANVTFCSNGEKGCVLGVASSTAGSGKSFVMANLALSLSQLIDKKVLLVDADMRCPIQHRIFRLENRQGLSNLLAGQLSDSGELRQSLSPSLDLITSGTIPPNPIALLFGPMMKAQMERWKEEYDYILVDLPPMGELSDGLAISELVSGYLHVLRSGMNDIHAVREISEMIADRGSEVLGYILTDVEEEAYRLSSYYISDEEKSQYYSSVGNAASFRSEKEESGTAPS